MVVSKRRTDVAELIRRVLHGDRVRAAKFQLLRAGGEAVEPILHAMTGNHGRLHPDRRGEAIDDLLDVLVAIAKRDSEPLAEAMAHDVPGVNAVAWAIGHSSSNHATQILHHFRDHEDGAVRSVAEHHLSKRKGRGSPRRTKKA